MSTDDSSTGFWDEVSDELVGILGTPRRALGDVENAVTTVEVVLVLLAIAVVLFVVFNPNILKGVKLPAVV